MKYAHIKGNIMDKALLQRLAHFRKLHHYAASKSWLFDCL